MKRRAAANVSTTEMQLREKFRELRNPVGTQPIAWSNDDFPELGGSTSLEQCLGEMRTAGYAGTELGRKFPRTPPALRAALGPHDLRLISGWHSTHLATRNLGEERDAFLRHLDLLRSCGASVVIVAECSHRTYPQPDQPLDFTSGTPALTAGEWQALCHGLTEFAALARDGGLTLVYHHHLGTVVQSATALEKLLGDVPTLGLLYDTGHLTAAGIDPLTVLHRYGPRIGHVHLKNVRTAVLTRARAEAWSFACAVTGGLFTVPGDVDGCVDFASVLAGLAALDYRGWLVVEAEQDPARANPLHYATLARDYIRLHTGL